MISCSSRNDWGNNVGQSLGVTEYGVEERCYVRGRYQITVYSFEHVASLRASLIRYSCHGIRICSQIPDLLSMARHNIGPVYKGRRCPRRTAAASCITYRSLLWLTIPDTINMWRKRVTILLPPVCSSPLDVGLVLFYGLSSQACAIYEVRLLMLFGYIFLMLGLLCCDHGSERSGQHANQAFGRRLTMLHNPSQLERLSRR